MKHREASSLHLQLRDFKFARTAFNINVSDLVYFYQTCNEGRQKNAGENCGFASHILLCISQLNASASWVPALLFSSEEINTGKRTCSKATFKPLEKSVIQGG